MEGSWSVVEDQNEENPKATAFRELQKLLSSPMGENLTKAVEAIAADVAPTSDE